MTEVAFHFGATDRLAYTCRLLRKATASGARLVVRANPETRLALDMALWSLGPTDFVTHCDSSAPAAMRTHSAILLVDSDAAPQPDFPILVNLADDVLQGFDAFERVIEIVSTDAHERSLARQRWKHYTDCGYTITRHDLKTRAGD